MPLPPRRLITGISAGLTLGWSLLGLGVMYAGGMAALRILPAGVMETGGPLITALAVVAIAAAAGLLSVTGVWVFGGPMMHAIEVAQADRLARRPAAPTPRHIDTDRWVRLAHRSTLVLLPLALALVWFGR